ncbi:SMI1/KNR4 family protein [Pseudomonas sp. EKM23D]|uniref:SMI1/KNR4 family protein n=1 Tax=Pseudomonas TaxID=286 RepID=UPI00142D8F51|nr:MULTISPECIES: SMI1/KNR4 family protein [Pseudomonas]KAF6686156.1 SMI1/KNR4 family protein [Pseudomonas sp. EKM23D]QKJ73560.1 SMI1/KNR4 family protein [Pseudomonas rhodesiae]
MLLTIEQIESQLKTKFKPFGSDMNDLILKRRTSPPININMLEKSINTKIPNEFRLFIEKYNMNNFTLGPISFGTSEDYIEQLIEINTDNEFCRWWTGKSRPANTIAIATSDPYTILLNTENGKIFAITSESNMSDWKTIACNFEMFARGVGTIFLKQGDPSEVVSAVNAENGEFWQELLS